MPDAHANFAVSNVITAPVSPTAGTSLTVAMNEGARFPATPFNAVVCPANVIPIPANAEVVRVTARASDVFTITRATEGSSARSIQVGDQIFAAVTAKTLTDIEATTGVPIPNPDFEHDANGGAPAIWSNADATFLVTGATLTADNAQQHSGSQSMKIVTTATNLHGAGLAIPWTFVCGVTYTVTFWSRGQNTDLCRVLLGDATENANNFFNLVNGAWQQTSVSFTPTANRNDLRLLVRQETAAAKTFWVDDFHIAQAIP